MKIIITIILSFVILNTYADVMIPPTCWPWDNPAKVYCERYRDNNFLKDNAFYVIFLLFIIIPSIKLLLKIKNKK